MKAKFHYRQGSVDGIVYKLNDTAYVKVCLLFDFENCVFRV
jgi:hypothetical protein